MTIASLFMFIKYIGGACLAGYILAHAIIFFTEDEA